MRLTLTAFGLELDVSFGIAGAGAEEDPAAALNGGTTQGYFMAPVARPEMPDEIPGVDRNNGWGDEDHG